MFSLAFLVRTIHSVLRLKQIQTYLKRKRVTKKIDKTFHQTLIPVPSLHLWGSNKTFRYFSNLIKNIVVQE